MTHRHAAARSSLTRPRGTMGPSSPLTNPMRKFLIVFLVGVVAGLVGVLSVTRAVHNADGRRYVDLSSPAVIRQTASLGRLETSSFSIEKIVEAGTGGTGLREFLFGDKLLLIARGDVIAGVDLSAVTEGDVTIDGDALTLSVPAPEIFTSALRSGETRVYDRTQGLFSRADKDLESEARASAEAAIRQAACDAGILDDARVNARKQLTALFTAAGFSTVVIKVPPGSCAPSGE